MTTLFAFVLMAGCGQSPPGGYDLDGGVLLADGMVPADSMDATQSQDDASMTQVDGGEMNADASLPDSNTVDTADANVVIGTSDGGVGEVHDGGVVGVSDAGVPGCYSDDDCPEGQICVDGQCVCDGDGDDGDDESCASGKALLCHYPPGNPANLHNICVGTPAVPAHLAHGDTLGVCP